MLTIRRLSKAFRGRAVLEDFSWVVPSNARCAITGPVGAGKTTLLRLIAGLESPDRGDIAWRDSPWSRGEITVPPWQRSLAMVFQQPTLWPHLRVREQLEYVLRGSGLVSSERNRRIEGLLGELGSLELARRHPSELSGGQQQCVALARALVREPPLLLLDEPFSHMDEVTRNAAWDLVTRDAQRTIVLVTHDADWAKRVCDDVQTLSQR